MSSEPRSPNPAEAWCGAHLAPGGRKRDQHRRRDEEQATHGSIIASLWRIPASSTSSSRHSASPGKACGRRAEKAPESMLENHVFKTWLKTRKWTSALPVSRVLVVCSVLRFSWNRFSRPTRLTFESRVAELRGVCPYPLPPLLLFLFGSLSRVLGGFARRLVLSFMPSTGFD